MPPAGICVESIAYNRAGSMLRREFATVVDRAYGWSDESGGVLPLHDPALDAHSFFIRLDGKVVSYAAVVTKTIRHGDETFRASGLSCVATDPDFQRRGLAARVVAAATRHIETSGGDLGVFTCVPELAPLYEAAGSWPVAPDVVLVVNREPGALSSVSLGVVVLLRLFSEKARTPSGALLHGTIDLDLPVGGFW
jgi:ribosomal protein S18 acetylase RimI-like enzyme